VTIAAGCESRTVLHSTAPVSLSNAISLPPPPNAPCVPTITLPSAIAGVARALSPGTPLAAVIVVFQICVAVARSTAYRLPLQSGT